MKIGLILEGGAMRGMYTAGVLDVFMENRIEFDAAIGVSAGAVFGCNIQSRQIGRTIRYNMKYCRDWRYVGLRSWITTGDLYGVDFDYRLLPEVLDPFDIRTFSENPMQFWCAVTDAVTGKPVYHRCTTGTGRDMLFMRASASMPIASRPVIIDGRQYLDGGIADSVPLRFFERQGYERNVVLLTQPADYRKQPLKHFELVRLMLRKYPAVVERLRTRHEYYNRQIEYIRTEEKKGNTLVICPDSTLHIGSVCKDPDELHRVYGIGRQTGEKYLPKVRDFVGPGHIAQWEGRYTRKRLRKRVRVG